MQGNDYYSFLLREKLLFLTKIIPTDLPVMYLDRIKEIDGVMVRNEVLEVPFVCDLNKCKGACCTLESNYGAPLLEDEIAEIEKVLPEVLPLLPEEHRKEIEKNGFHEKKEGELMTRSVNRRACVFVYFDGDIAKCAMELAYKQGKTGFYKPISCHLFPIRISRFGGDVLRYEEFSECTPALENGAKLKVSIARFCKDSLTRLYGAKWFEKLRELTRF